jgi:hypothetical protein
MQPPLSNPLPSFWLDFCNTLLIVLFAYALNSLFSTFKIKAGQSFYNCKPDCMISSFKTAQSLWINEEK